MKTITLVLAIFFLMIQPLSAMDDDLLDEFDLDDQSYEISDPLEPLNRAFFQFNDKLYTYVLSPVAESYAAVLPTDIRTCISNAFNNLLAPVRIVNTLLQGKISKSGTELLRFVINTTAGAAGMGDPAKDVFGIQPAQEDLGQTLGKYGFGDGVYICWPILGPSNIRDTVGLVGDAFLNPLSYIFFNNAREGLAVNSTKLINETSLELGEYEEFVESSFDPYIAMRDFYTESRRSKILDKHTDSLDFSDQASFPNVDGINRSAMVGTLDKAENTSENSTEGNVEINEKTDGFFIQLGVFTEKENSNLLAKRLLSIDKAPLIVEYRRNDYTFYGIQVEGGNEFLMAKAVEQELNDAGFKETLVLLR